MKMKTKIDINDFIHMIIWVKTFYAIEGKKFNYDNLIEQANTYRLKNTPLDTRIHQIDDLMIDAFLVYQKLKETEEKVNELFQHIEIPFFNKDLMKNETDKYSRIVEDLIENYKYEDPEIRGIQRGFLEERMKEYIADEDYENAAKVRDMIKELK